MIKQKKKILIIRFSSIGDILLTTPFIRQVRSFFPNAHITYLVKKEFYGLIKFNHNINKVILFDSKGGYKSLKALAKNLAGENYSLVYDLHNNFRSNQVVKNFRDVKLYKIVKNKLKRFFFVYFKLNFYKKILLAPEKYLNVGVPSGVIDNGEKLEIFWSGETESFIEKTINQNNLIKDRYVCIAPGAAHPTKMWPIEKIVELIKKILMDTNIKIVLVGGQQEKYLLSEFNDDNRVVNFFGKLSLLETAAVINQSKGLITNDSGLMHMAVSVKKPLVAIFGSTAKELGFFPFRANAEIIENEKLWCRPCSHIGRNFCPLGHFKCMQDISVKQVYNVVREKLL